MLDFFVLVLVFFEDFEVIGIGIGLVVVAVLEDGPTPTTVIRLGLVAVFEDTVNVELSPGPEPPDPW